MYIFSFKGLQTRRCLRPGAIPCIYTTAQQQLKRLEEEKQKAIHILSDLPTCSNMGTSSATVTKPQTDAAVVAATNACKIKVGMRPSSALSKQRTSHAGVAAATNECKIEVGMRPSSALSKQGTSHAAVVATTNACKIEVGMRPSSALSKQGTSHAAVVATTNACKIEVGMRPSSALSKPLTPDAAVVAATKKCETGTQTSPTTVYNPIITSNGTVEDNLAELKLLKNQIHKLKRLKFLLEQQLRHSERMHIYEKGKVREKLARAELEKANMGEKLLGIFTKGQIKKLKNGKNAKFGQKMI
ncbi:PREDICTED: uncharacterized protein LOC108364317 isoform X1 [Rhagoletis zephyria]|uniref:uncharacterized protein LOC108364317 isoform X1 n=2 Tax=Rhagoletis zephyria TaxID=28612 RepID=UPI0008113655|nr:PREDICTED: uncharacterized protein LOC108364317 isoform X1 [Rhagoletis zephyria]